MTGRPWTSVIIPAYNAGATIDDCLGALASQTVPRESYEVLVVDDGSVDDTRSRVRAHDGVRLLRQAHAGPAAARNLGAEEAQGEILLFTDSDCVPARDWVAQMAAPFRDDNVAGVKGAYLTDQQEIVARFVQIEYEDKYDHMSREAFIDFVDTYAAGYRRQLFLSSGGFDTSFPLASVEDQEFSFRLAGRGYRMVFVPQARVHHLDHARTLGAYWRKKFKIGYWKVLVTRRHPAKALRDSHTPQSLKVQILLVGLGLVCLGGGLLWRPLMALSGILALSFLLTTIPFAFRAWHRDRVVALLAPGLLLVRALALGVGYAAGLVAHLGLRHSSGEKGRV
jgi:GT2 family glycosyltransferase